MDNDGSSCLMGKPVFYDDIDFFINFYNHLTYETDPGIEMIIKDCVVHKKDYKGIYEWNGKHYLVLLHYKNRELDNLLLYFFKTM